MPKFTGSTTIGNSQVFDNGTSVGIGTASPTRILDVRAADNGNAALFLFKGLNQVVWLGTGSSTAGAASGYLGLYNNSNDIGIQLNAVGNSYITGGNVLIGTTTDNGARLQVSGAATFSGNVGVKTSGRSESLSIEHTLGNNSALFVYTNGITAGQSYGLTVYAGTNSSDRSFLVANQGGGSPYLYVRGDGNVGIGTSSPDVTGFGWRTLTIRGGTTSGEAGVIELQSPTTTGAANLGIIAFMDGSNRNAQISVQRDSSTTTANMLFYTNPGAGIVERMRINSSGFLKVSNNSVYESASGGYHELNQSNTSATLLLTTHRGSDPYGIEVQFTGADPNNASNYMLGAYTTSGGFTGIYRIFSNGTVSARSDARWKKNIETTRNGYIDDLCKLRVVKYNWYNHEDDAPKELGLIAQEVEEVFPNLIQHDTVISKREVEQEDGTIVEEEFEDGTSRSIKVSVLPIMLLKAIQEQQQQIKELKAEIDTLKN